LSNTRTRLHGTLRNFNTIEEFKNCDKAALLVELGSKVRSLFLSRTLRHPLTLAPQIWTASTTEGETSTVESLNPFLLITFADLKKYRYYYWCGFPALAWKPGWEVEGSWEATEVEEPAERGEGVRFLLLKVSMKYDTDATCPAV
jgi:ubiquitin-like modifier-activating enzyme ATG7